MSYDVVKEISIVVKRNYRLLVKAKREIEEETKRFDELNNNIIEECDFSRKDPKEVIADTDFDIWFVSILLWFISEIGLAFLESPAAAIGGLLWAII